jgi:hypothetical protein
MEGSKDQSSIFPAFWAKSQKGGMILAPPLLTITYALHMYVHITGQTDRKKKRERERERERWSWSWLEPFDFDRPDLG